MTNTYRALSKAAEAALAEGVFERTSPRPRRRTGSTPAWSSSCPAPTGCWSNNYSAGKQGDTFDLRCWWRSRGRCSRAATSSGLSRPRRPRRSNPRPPHPQKRRD
jgi:hypothetical protein